MKNLLVTLFLFALSSSFSMSQNAQVQTGIESILIFQYHGGKTLTINENGKTNYGYEVSIVKLNKKIKKHLRKINYQKAEATNSPPSPVSEPQEGLKNVYVFIVLKKDKEASKSFRTPASYMMKYENVSQEFVDFDLLDFLPKKDRQKLRADLKNRN
jgi:hypothetical protein